MRQEDDGVQRRWHSYALPIKVITIIGLVLLLDATIDLEREIRASIGLSLLLVSGLYCAFK